MVFIHRTVRGLGSTWEPANKLISFSDPQSRGLSRVYYKL